MNYNYRRNAAAFVEKLKRPWMPVVLLPILALVLLGSSFGGSPAPIARDSSNRPFAVQMPVLFATTQTVVAVGVVAVTVPVTRQAGSRILWVCNSAENTGSPKVKCLMDGVPVMGLANPGDVLDKTTNPCQPYYLDSTHVLKCISDTAGTATTTSEYVPETPAL